MAGFADARKLTAGHVAGDDHRVLALVAEAEKAEVGQGAEACGLEAVPADRQVPPPRSDRLQALAQQVVPRTSTGSPGTSPT
ncbi:hypothetical protein ACIHFE_33040 [Streptomyces sp. NPDC052396]|uniref:hypothetical protein n=1 Tax=Streptomyces sp. NPDC052396 TaxID=3365689 RepID=UPI0037D1764F